MLTFSTSLMEPANRSFGLNEINNQRETNGDGKSQIT